MIPSQRFLHRLMSDRYCRPRLTTAICTNESNLRLPKKMQSLELTLHERKLTGEYQILIFHFLTHLAEEATKYDTSEGQMIVFLPRLLKRRLENNIFPARMDLAGKFRRIVHCP